MTAKFGSIQLLRAAAALMVVIWHTGDIDRGYLGSSLILPPFLRFGYAGVDLFFVISGFIICYVSLKKTFDPGNFVRKRLVRIYPFYAFFTLLALLLYLIDPSWIFHAGKPDIGQIVQSLLTWPQRRWPVLFVGWSLEPEVQFYVIAGILFALGREILLVPVLVALFVLGIVLKSAFGLGWDWYLVSPFHLEFAFGALVYFSLARVRAFGSLVPIAAGILLFLLTSWADSREFGDLIFDQARIVRVAGYGLGGALLLIGAINLDLPAPSGWARLLAAGVFLGDASYTLYLSHPFILYAAGKIGGRLHLHGLAADGMLAASVCASCLFAALFYRLVEKKLLDAVHERHRAARQPA